jgi:hypothetical protein
MSNSKISALTSATTPLAGTETLPVVQSSTTKQVSVANLTVGRAVSAASLALTTSPLPATSGGTGSNSAFTLYGVTYANATTTLTTSSGLLFNGSNLGIGVTPFANSAGVGLDISGGAGLFGFANGAWLQSNAYYNGGWLYKSSSYATSYQQLNGQHFFNIASSGTAGSAITFTTPWTIDNTGNFVQGTAAKGVNFTANTPASGMTSQLLNWYEEGTWTPNQGAGLTVVGTFSSSGKYTRIGRQVTLVAYVVGSVSIAAAAGNYICTNTPFASSFLTPGTTMNGNGTFGGNLYLATSSIVAVEAIASTSTIYFTVTYFV